MEKSSGHFVDMVRLHVRAGEGGKGCISFLRLKGIPFGGPDGGDGGRGGSVILQADHELATLIDLKTKSLAAAKNGENGGAKNCSGKSGEDVVVKVPLGTIVIDAETEEELGDLTFHGQQLVVAKGGDGGKGNQHYATPTNKAPKKAFDGWPGEARNLILELKVIADAGFVGLPNAGKSTLLAALTDANPKIASYPFTTLSPNLGVFIASDFKRRITLADIPGLIEGASKGAGLGHRFLRHIERTRVIVHLVAPEAAGEAGDGEMTLADADPDAIIYAWELVRNELISYSEKLLKKPTITCLNKADLLTGEEINAIVDGFRERHGVEVLVISAGIGTGLDEVRSRIDALVLEADRVEATAREIPEGTVHIKVAPKPAKPRHAGKPEPEEEEEEPVIAFDDDEEEDGEIEEEE